MEKHMAALVAAHNQVKDVPTMHLKDFDSTDTLLAVIDINNGFAKAGALYSNRVEAKIGDIASLSKKALKSSMTVLAYTDHHPEGAKEFGAYPPHCVGDTVESQLVEELEALKEQGLREIHKNSTNGVLAYNPLTEEENIKNVIVIGCVTDICVYQYAVTLRAYMNEHNLEGDVYVVRDLVQTFDIPDFHHGDMMHEIFLKSMIDNGVKVIADIV